MAIDPRRDIQGPRAQAPRVGLLATFPRLAEPDSVWQHGITYEREGCVEANTPLDPCGSVAKPTPETPTTITWDPYVIHQDFRCSTFSLSSADNLNEARATVRRRLAAMESHDVERELWTGAAAQAAGWDNRFLASHDADVVTEAGAVTPTVALGCLTQYLAETAGGAQGVIHAQPLVVTQWAAADLLYRSGTSILTVARDDLVVSGGGYPGTDPNGNPAVTGDVWAYATDLITVRLGEVQVYGGDAETIDRANNVVDIRAERLAIASWPGCRHAGAQIDIETCGIGGS